MPNTKAAGRSNRFVNVRGAVSSKRSEPTCMAVQYPRGRYPDGTFDLVTCQTVLMHLKDPLLALSEIKRVLKEGGTILCVEPINIINRFDFSSVSAVADIQLVIRAYRLWLYFERGIKVLQKGDHDIGSYLPGLLEKVGFRAIQVFTNDKGDVVTPSTCQIDAPSSWEDEETIRERALAGGASEAEIAEGLAAHAELQKLKRTQMERGEFSQASIAATLIVGANRETTAA